MAFQDEYRGGVFEDSQVSKKWLRTGECNREYNCAKLNCCGDCEYLEKKGNSAVCIIETSKPQTCIDSPTFMHWIQRTYWNRGIACSFTFKEAVEVMP